MPGKSRKFGEADKSYSAVIYFGALRNRAKAIPAKTKFGVHTASKGGMLPLIANVSAICMKRI